MPYRPSYLKLCRAHNLSSTPRVRWEVAKRWSAKPPHGSFTPAVVLTEPPNAVMRSRREYHCHFGCHGRTRGHPVSAAGPLARLRGEGRGAPNCRSLCFRTPKLMYLTNEYSIVEETYPPRKRKIGGRFEYLPLHLLPHLEGNFSPLPAKYFLIVLKRPLLTASPA